MTWSELVDAAVMGTSREPAVLAASGAVSTADPPARLLRRAAELSRARRAGYRPPLAADLPAPVPVPADHRPEVGPAAAWRLESLLASGDHELAAEWLRLLAGQSGPRPDQPGSASLRAPASAAAPAGLRRPPDAVLPALLTVAANHAELRGALLPVLGPLAAWLADFNADWDWVPAAHRPGPDPQADRERWETGTGAIRRALLSRLRASDPAAGRDLVASTWDSDAHRDRAAFVALLVTGLGPDDEALAERGLADRRAEVRAAAAALLARLPASSYSRRAAARAAAAVRVDHDGAAPRLVLAVPDLPAAELTADGLDISQAASMGVKGSLLRQIVAAAPARLWAAHANLDPAALLELAARTDWPDQLRAGFTHAAARDKDEAWLTALLDLPGRADIDRDLPLLAALPPGTLADWLERNAGSPLLLPALEALAPPWDARVSAMVSSVLAAMAAKGEPAYPARALIRIAAMRLEPPQPPPGVIVAEQLTTTWSHFLQTLSVRAAMRRELAEEPHQ